MPVDPCSSLTEGQCMLDHDLCTPQYGYTEQACPPCQGPGCDFNCGRIYLGCVTIGDATDGGVPPDADGGTDGGEDGGRAP